MYGVDDTCPDRAVQRLNAYVASIGKTVTRWKFYGGHVRCWAD